MVVEGGGEKKGMEGKVVGMVGRFGSEVAAGSGGSVSCGMVGMLGIEGCGRDGIVVGKGGTFPRGTVGTVGKGGNCNRWRAPNAKSMLDKEIAMKKAKMVQL